MTIVFNEISKKYKTINMLINNAAIAFNDYFYNLSEKKLIKTIEINLSSPMVLTRKFLEKMGENSEEFHVVNIASNLAHMTTRKSAPYIASKWGLFGMHDSIRYGIFSFILKNFRL